MMRKIQGFTLVELVMFIVITGLLATTILMALSLGTQRMPTIHQQTLSTQTAQKCMEWLIGQRSLNGYDSLTCPNTTTPSFCTAPTGFSISTNITCTTISGDASYKTITVAVSGAGSAALTTLIGDY